MSSPFITPLRQVVLGANTALFDPAERAPVTIASYEMLRNHVRYGVMGDRGPAPPAFLSHGTDTDPSTPPLPLAQEHKMGKWEWNCVIFDESHKLGTRRSTNAPTRFVEVALKVAAQARRIVMLSGYVRPLCLPACLTACVPAGAVGIG